MTNIISFDIHRKNLFINMENEIRFKSKQRFFPSIKYGFIISVNKRILTQIKIPGILWHRKAHWCPYSTHSFTSSQFPKGPGAKPSAQAHSKLPSRFEQVPLPQILGLVKHSSSSTHFLPLKSDQGYILLGFL